MSLLGSQDSKNENIIGEGSKFEGQLSINGTLRVDGTFEGQSLKVNDQLYIGKKGKVKTNIQAGNLFVEGVIIGNITAETRVVLQSSARVLGEIRTPEIIIQNGVILEGKCTISNDLKTSASNLITALYRAD